MGDVCLYLDELTAYTSLFALQDMGIRVPFLCKTRSRIDFEADRMLEDCACILIDYMK